MKLIKLLIVAAVAAWAGAAAPQPRFDVLIAGGTVYDGTGGPGVRADTGISGDRITAIAPSLAGASAGTVIGASGLAVTPDPTDVADAPAG